MLKIISKLYYFFIVNSAGLDTLPRKVIVGKFKCTILFFINFIFAFLFFN